MGSEQSKPQLALDHFYYTNQPFVGKLIISKNLLNQARHITIKFYGKISIQLEGMCDSVEFCSITKEINISEQENPLIYEFKFGLNQILPPSTFVVRSRCIGRVEYFVDASINSDDIFGPTSVSKLVQIRNPKIAQSMPQIPLQLTKEIDLNHGVCLVDIKINKEQYSMGDIVEITLNYDNRSGLIDIEYFSIELIQDVSVQEEYSWLSKHSVFNQQATKGIGKQEQNHTPYIIQLQIIDQKGLFQQKCELGFITIKHFIQISAHQSYFTKYSTYIPIDICLNNSKCAYQNVEDVNHQFIQGDLGKIQINEDKLQENFYNLKALKLATKAVGQLMKRL